MPRTERAKRFTSRREIEQARARLSPASPIPLDQFADLVGDYRLPKTEQVRCQLVDDTGKCNTLHGWGWIAQLLDGTEGFIGHDCVEGHFKDDPRFKELFELAAVRAIREITTDALVRRLSQLKADPALPATLNAATSRFGRLHDRILGVRNLLHPEVLRKLRDREKRRNAAVTIRVVYFETEIDEKTKQPRKVTKPQERVWGTLAGLEGLNISPANQIGGRLAEASAALIQSIASIDQPTASMRRWAKALEYVARADAELGRLERSIDSFCRPENLKLLWLLLHHRLDQIAVASTVLEIASRKQPTEADATAARDFWAQEIRDAHDGLGFEIVG